MFENTKEEMMEQKAAHEARKMLAKMMSQTILELDTAPESVKLSVRVMDKAADVRDAWSNLVENYVDVGKRANAETLKNVLAYLELVEVGIKQFVETTPFVAEETEAMPEGLEEN
jgi:hypothetical protein